MRNHILFPIIVAIMVGVLLLGQHIVFETFVYISHITNPTILFAIHISLLSLLIGFIALQVVSSYYNTIVTRILYTFTALWLGMGAYLFIISMLYGLLLALGILFNFDQYLLVVGQGLFVVAILTSLYGFINARVIQTTRISQPIHSIPISWKGKTALFLSDIHLGQVYNVNRAKRIVRKINNLNPDIVFIGGDLFDGVQVDINAVLKPFKNVKPKLGTYFVMGNHEEFHDNSKYARGIKNVGITILNNEVVTIDGLQIIGVDYHDTVGKERFANTLASLNLKKEHPSILIKHVPLDLDLAEINGISFQMSGHTHRAQFFPFMIITKALYKGYDYGLKRYKKMMVYTSSGVGGWGPPMRVGTKSEIVHITF